MYKIIYILNFRKIVYKSIHVINTLNKKFGGNLRLSHDFQRIVTLWVLTSKVHHQARGREVDGMEIKSMR